MSQIFKENLKFTSFVFMENKSEKIKIKWITTYALFS